MKGNTWGLGVTGIQTPAKEKPPGFSVFQVGKFPPTPTPWVCLKRQMFSFRVRPGHPGYLRRNLRGTRDPSPPSGHPVSTWHVRKVDTPVHWLCPGESQAPQPGALFSGGLG